MARVFVSDFNTNSHYAEEFAQCLIDLGHQVINDGAAFSVGDDLGKAFGDAVRKSDVVVFLFSQDNIDSPWSGYGMGFAKP